MGASLMTDPLADKRRFDMATMNCKHWTLSPDQMAGNCVEPGAVLTFPSNHEPSWHSAELHVVAVCFVFLQELT